MRLWCVLSKTKTTTKINGSKCFTSWPRPFQSQPANPTQKTMFGHIALTSHTCQSYEICLIARTVLIGGRKGTATASLGAATCQCGLSICETTPRDDCARAHPSCRNPAATSLHICCAMSSAPPTSAVPNVASIIGLWVAQPRILLS